MRERTHISYVIEENANKDQYDAEVKKILADKTILAWIMKYSVEEFEDYTIEEIRDCIEGTPEIATVKVRPGHTPEAIGGMPNEDKIPGEGNITYDIRFYAVTRDAMQVKIIINVEAQKNFYPGYDLVTRAVFYCARMLSAQLDTEFTAQNYDDVKKVYSIWVCMNAPDYAAYTITKYKMTRENAYGCVGKKHRYDLLEAVMICLGKEEKIKEGNKLHGMLATLLSGSLSPQEKEQILEEEYGIETTVEMEGGLRQMCNLSDLIEEKGIVLNLMELVAEGHLEIGIAAEKLNITVEEFAKEMERWKEKT